MYVIYLFLRRCQKLTAGRLTVYRSTEMSTVGIIAEFNPFHNGHAYLIEEAKRRTGAQYCAIAMSGDFVQRGAPAFCDKYLRAEMALRCGADAVFEIPTAYACASAEFFAEAGVKLLAGTGSVDYLAFGAETDDLKLIGELAAFLADEPEEYGEALREGLKEGKSYPSARAAAVGRILGNEYAALLDGPNNVLAIEYCKAVEKLKKTKALTDDDSFTIPKITVIKRRGNGYDSSALDGGGFSSASAIRQLLGSGKENIETLKEHVPEPVFEITDRICGSEAPVNEDMLGDMLKVRLLTMSAEEKSEIMGLSGELLNGVQKHAFESMTYSETINCLKNRSSVYTGISRALLHLILGIDRNYEDRLKAELRLPYTRLLGFKKENSAFLRSVSDNTNCGLITKLADADLSEPMLKTDIIAASLYSQLVLSNYGKRLPDEVTRGPVIIP